MRGEGLRQTTSDTKGYPWAGLDGMLIMLKVMTLLAGYTIFVWITMTQLERRYLAPQATAAAGLESPKQPVPVPGAVTIQARSRMMVSESGTGADVPPVTVE